MGMKTELYNERWRSIKGYEGIYEVSDYGRIRSIDRFVEIEVRGRKIKKKYKSKIIKPSTINSGYQVVWLSKHGEVSPFSVHRIVAIAYIENPNDYEDVNHKNGNKKDNRVENLEWCTRRENIQHCYHVLGRKPPVVTSVRCVETGEKYASIKDAARATNLTPGAISHAINGFSKTAGVYRWEKV